MSVISLSERRTLGLKNLGDRSEVQKSSGLRGGHFNFEKPPEGISSIGIDLGTTNSVVSIYETGQVAPVTLEFDHALMIPSVVFWNGEESLVGSKAIAAAGLNPHELIRSSKRKMGRSAKHPKLDQAQLNFVSNNRKYSAEEAAAEILRYIAMHPYLVKEKERFGGLWVVITVPAHFDDAARRATLEAAHEAGLSVMRIINEPTAAALAYSFLKDEANTQLVQEDLVVFDLGGGTFDVSVVHRDDLIFKVLASEGDMELGGDDLDKTLASHLGPLIEPAFLGKRLETGSESYKALVTLAGQIKHALTESGEVEIDEKIGHGRLKLKFTRDECEALMMPLLERTLHLTEQAIHGAKRRAKDVSRILLVGGSTRLPLIRKMLESYFPQCAVDSRLQPDLAVSWGAALQSAIILGTAPETVLVDVCNHTLGIGVVDDSQAIHDHYQKVQKKFGLSGQLSDSELRKKLGKRMEEFNIELQRLLRVAPIIRRNSSLPARKSEFFSTLFENQPAVHVIVAQGEGETVGDNRLIGSFLFDLVQPCPKGTKCEIQLTYDVNGMVQVFARQLGTENQAKAQFDSRTGVVKGWTAVHDSWELDPERGASKRSRQSDSEAHTARPIASAKETAAQVSGLQSQGERPMVLNALLGRAKRLVRRLAQQSGSVVSDSNPVAFNETKLKQLMQTYNDLLHSALSGEALEEELEQAEGELLAFVQRLEEAEN